MEQKPQEATVTDWTPDEERVARALEPDAWLNRDVVFSEDIETGLRVVLPSIHAARRAIAAIAAMSSWRDVKTDPPPRDGTEVLVKLGRIEDERWRNLSGRLFVVRHMGFSDRMGIDLGWSLFPGFGCSENWLACWQPIAPPLPPAPETNREE